MKIYILITIVLQIVIPSQVFCGDLSSFIDAALLRGETNIVVPEGRYFADGVIHIGAEFDGVKIIAQNHNVEVFSSQTSPVFLIENVSCFELAGFSFKSLPPEGSASQVGFYFKSGMRDWTSGATAVYVKDSSFVTISNNKIIGYWIGIYVSSVKNKAENILVNNNEVVRCGYWSIAARCRKVKEEDGNVLQYVRFTNNDISSCEQGPVFRNVTYGKIDGNIVSGNIQGVRVEQSHFCIIENNNIFKNLLSGILIYHESSHNKITANRIRNNNLQISKIRAVAKLRKFGEESLFDDFEQYGHRPKSVLIEYGEMVGGFTDTLFYDPVYWPYPTAYDYITPSNRVENFMDYGLNEKFWGIYFSQFGRVGIELRMESSYNIIEHNEISNSAPLDIDVGYMFYGVQISHISRSDRVSDYNIIRNNNIVNMVKSRILDVNSKHGVENRNVFN